MFWNISIITCYNNIMTSSSKALPKSVPGVIDGKTYTYHAHSFAEVMTVLGVTDSGLSEEEAKRRQKRHGLNSFSEQKTRSVLTAVIDQLRSPLTFVLVLAFVVTFALEEYLDAGVIALALFIAVFVGLLQEGKASRAFSHLAKSQTHNAIVWRDGKKHLIDASQVTVGDIVVLQSGSGVPADLRLIRAKQLTINEASLTGEWQAVDKGVKAVSVGTPFAEQSSMAWMGTFVAEGYGMGVVTAIGDQTSMGQLADSLSEVVEVKTPLQHEMEKISKIMLTIIIVLVVIIFAIGLWEGYRLHDMLLMSIAIAVASVPEGLPAAITIILAVGMEALLKRGGLVRNLLAAETLGSTTYVLTDKTGTLTKAKMAVAGAIVGDGSLVGGEALIKNKNVEEMIAVSLCAIDAFVDTENGKRVYRGDSVEQAILKASYNYKQTEHSSVYRANRVDYLAFTSEQRFAAGLAEPKADKFLLCINGAPSLLLDSANSVFENGRVLSLTKERKEQIQTAIDTATAAGQRLVAVSSKEVDYEEIPSNQRHLISESTFLGVIILDDPVREGVDKAIAGVQAAGAKVILITGDNPATAFSIAKQVGIAGEGDSVLTGTDLEKLSDEELMLALENVHVYARVLPKQKLLIASLLQQKGEIVAMTGDGINDAPALRRANIGIAIGSGTEVAKESSDLVLVEDSFATIYAAIEEGRRIIANLRKIVGYLLSTSLSEVVLIGAALLTGAAIPILPAQILWANVIEEGLMSVAFAFEKGEPNAMKRRPQDIHEEGILSREMLWFIALVVTVLSMLTLTLYFYVRALDLPIETLRSIMFLSVAVDSLFMSFAFRSLSTPIWKIPLRNNWFFVGSFLLSLALLAAALTVPFFQYVLSYQPLELKYMVLVGTFSALSLVVIELAKWLYFRPD